MKAIKLAGRKAPKETKIETESKGKGKEKEKVSKEMKATKEMKEGKEAKEEPVAKNEKQQKVIAMVRKARQEGKAEGYEQGKEDALKDGYAEAIAKGQKDGIRKGKMDVAYNLLYANLVVNYVVKMTDLPKKDIENLKSQMIEDDVWNQT